MTKKLKNVAMLIRTLRHNKSKGVSRNQRNVYYKYVRPPENNIIKNSFILVKNMVTLFSLYKKRLPPKPSAKITFTTNRSTGLKYKLPHA